MAVSYVSARQCFFCGVSTVHGYWRPSESYLLTEEYTSTRPYIEAYVRHLFDNRKMTATDRICWACEVKANRFFNRERILDSDGAAKTEAAREIDLSPESWGEGDSTENSFEPDNNYQRISEDVQPCEGVEDGEATVPAGNSGRHEGYRCNVCRGEIVGFRYACVQCIDFDLCVACEADSKHAAHYMLRVPASKPDMEARAIIETIRYQLLKQDVEHRIKVENLEGNDLEETQDPLVTNDDACVPPQDTSCQNTSYEESKNLLTVKYLGLMKETNQPVFRVESHLPKAESHQPIAQSQQPLAQPRLPKAQSHQVKAQSQDPLVTCPQKRPLMLEGSETDSAFLWEVPVKGELEGCEGESVGEEGCFTTYTHRAPAKVRSSSEESAPTSKKRKT